ncbi:MAG TPA: hypothetical protein PKO38_02500 [Bacillota bacterium]|nr:hypothetical protein [Bacillota bacterium]HOB86544.1 hypothetical protein [Bacillota bacterium]HOP68969.1 hypothetical protein [Bacillota bacterium]HPT33883.1 hypothetical protein [Bacillota bacterium]HPZ64158.1 hypothetical protein [Bacillota bacterium]
MEPLVLAAVSLWTGFLASGVVKLYRGRGLVKKNYRGRPVAPALGPVLIIGHLPAVVLPAWSGRSIPLALTADLAFLGVAFSGLWDDLLEDEVSGFQGHLRSGLQGRITSGLLKIAAMALAAAPFCGLLESSWPHKIAALLLVLASANGLNLLDRRPGRALKLFFGGSLLLLFSAPQPEMLRLLLPWLAAALVVAPWDLDAEGMLGDCGANLLGAVLGVGAVLALPLPAQLGLLFFWLAVNLSSEVVSFSRLIEEVPLLRFLDLLGRSREKIS